LGDIIPFYFIKQVFILLSEKHNYPSTDEAQAALFKDPVRTAL
jgi:hypothetical protein